MILNLLLFENLQCSFRAENYFTGEICISFVPKTKISHKNKHYKRVAIKSRLALCFVVF